MSSEQARLYRFGDFVLNVESGELRHNGGSVRLQPQLMELLLALLSRPGEIVTREQLQSSMWDADTYVEFGDALNHAVRRLRSALGDTAQVPRYIETIPRRGYRLIVPAGVEFSKPEQNLPPDDSGPLRSNRSPWLVVAAVLSIAAALIAAYVVRADYARPRISALAVLPFTNLSANPDQEYFADGVTDTLTADLSQIRSLRVVSRTSAMHYKGSKQTAPEIARELGVDGIVEGSVLRDGGRIRITVQLIHAPSDTHVWASSYERDARNALSLQSDIAMAVVEALRAQLKPEETSRLLQARTVKPEAFDWYMQGRYWWSKRNPEGIQKALDCFQRAIDADRNYALAYSGLADSLRMASAFNLLPSTAEVRARQAAAAQTAVHLDGGSAEAHTSLAVVYQREMRWKPAEAEFQRAMELNPSYAVAHHWYAGYLILQGRLDEALQQARLTQALDPLYLPAAMTLANALRLLGRVNEADAQLDRVLKIDPDFVMAHCFRRSIREDQGRFSEAIEEGARCDSPGGTEQNRSRATAMRTAFSHQGASGYWNQKLKFGQEDFGHRSDREFDIILAYAHLGDQEHALEWLISGDCRTKIFALHEPILLRLRADARFQRFRECLHLQP